VNECSLNFNCRNPVAYIVLLLAALAAAPSLRCWTWRLPLGC
jgi:hypothetical protein